MYGAGMGEDESSQQPQRDPLPPGTVNGSFRVDHQTARLPESVGAGQFANALMVAAGPLEFILDFVQKLGEPPRVVARVVMPPVVAGQFLQALKHNVGLYEGQFGPLPTLPRPKATEAASDAPAENTAQMPPVASETTDQRSDPSSEQSADTAGESDPADPPVQTPGGSAIGSGGGIVGPGIEPGSPQSQQAGQSYPGGPNSPPVGRPIQDIYDELRLDDELLSGRYCNAVIVRHTPAEFALEFITRFMPHSAVSSRVIVAAPNIPSLMGSLEQALADYRRRQGPPGPSGPPPSRELPPPSEN